MTTWYLEATKRRIDIVENSSRRQYHLSLTIHSTTSSIDNVYGEISQFVY